MHNLQKYSPYVQGFEPYLNFPLYFFPATEIRCQEKSKGGLCYEVILAEPSVQAAVPKIPVNPAKIVSAEDIEEKLKAAEERRLVSRC